MAKVNFEFFSKSFEISSEFEDEEYLQKLIMNFREKIEKLQYLTKIDDHFKLLVYFAINLLDENIKIKKTSLENELNKPSYDFLIKKLERILEEENDTANTEKLTE